MNITYYTKNIWITFLFLMLFTFSFASDPNWEDDVNTGAEFSATLANAIVVIDGQTKQTGKLAAFAGGEVIGVDASGAVFFPPSGAYLWEASLYSDDVSAGTISFKYWDDVTDEVIDLDQTVEWEVNAIYGESAFDPFEFTGVSSGDDGGGDDGDCISGDQNWEDDVNTGAEFSATLANAIVVIDGQTKQTGKLAAFAGGEVIGVDASGAVFFPPSGAYLWEASLYSDDVSAGTISFKYWDDESDLVIDLDQTVEWEVNAIYGESAFDPFELTGSAPTDCEGECDDLDADGLCDDVDDCVGEYDECGVCNGDGIADGACDCDGNVDLGCGCGEAGPSGCDETCGSDLEFDECGVCGGDGIADGACDCDGNVDLGCGCGEAGPSGCDETCGSDLEFDECGVCGGDDSSCSGCTDPLAENYDGDATIEDGTCVYASGPAAFAFTQSSAQAFYYVFNANINEEFPTPLDSNDWVGAFKDLNGDGKGDVCVGSKKWDPAICLGGICDIALMGVDPFNLEDTENYMEEGDVPVFMVYDASENAFYDAKVSSTSGYYFEAINYPWSSGQAHIVNEITVQLDCNDELGGHAFTDYCENCVEGGTGLEENYADLGCGCDNDAPLTYCFDTDTDELGNPGTDELYCLSDDSIDCSSDFNNLWDDSDNDQNFCYDNVPVDWYLDCSDECINDVENDFDGDDICGDVDTCPYDNENDFDGDGICGDVDDCPYDSQNDIDNDEICGDVDECPYDNENDADGDGICGDVDECPYDAENDADNDEICGDVDECPYDNENDADSDNICGDVDECPYDYYNDADDDGQCGDVDPCPNDAEDDADNDGICGDVDDCPYDENDDWDNDGICADVDTCPDDQDNDFDGDGQCDCTLSNQDNCLADSYDSCPDDFYNDIDGDGFCADVDDCPYDDENDIDGDGQCNCTLEDETQCPYDGDDCPYDDDNDADGDGICGDVDECPFDEENDIDGDGYCGDVDECPYDYYNDADDDGQCGDVDPCPNDAEDDADGDEICGDVDECPYDNENDADGDEICGDVDECPYDAENDFDGDDICGDVDECPYDSEDDADDDGICGDVDDCPYDDENDADSDGICGNVDVCPYDDENDADLDGICGDVDICSYDPLNDIDGDGLCCSDQDGDGINDDTGSDYFGDDALACECATNYFDCSSDCVDPDSVDADTIDDCGTCDDTDWNDCFVDYTVDLHDNANLTSFFVLPEDTSVDNIFSGVTSNLLAIANGTSAALYDYPDWSGGLTDIDQAEGYWVVMSEDDELSISNGTPIDPNTEYELNAGASLIGYPLNNNAAFETALGAEAVLGNVYAVFGEGISAYNYNGLWIGSLQYFTPNSGYWFLSNNAIDFSYQSDDGLLGRQDSEYIKVPKNPNGYDYYQSKRQSFYYVENIEDIQINDWVLAYNDDVLVGARQYSGGIVDIPVMGYDDSDFTAGYCENGDVPEFKLFRSSTGMLNELSGNITGWTSNTVTILDDLSLTNMPTEVSLSPAYPNPFNPSTSLSYAVPQDGNITLSVYDINGRLVENLVNSYQKAGNYNAVWNASSISSGVYFVRLSASSEILTQKVMLIK